MTSKKVGMLKQRMKVLAESNAIKREKNIPVEITIDDKIQELNSRIKGCKYDLEHNFPDNEIIKSKIKDYEERVEKLEEEKNNQQVSGGLAVGSPMQNGCNSAGVQKIKEK